MGPKWTCCRELKRQQLSHHWPSADRPGSALFPDEKILQRLAYAYTFFFTFKSSRRVFNFLNHIIAFDFKVFFFLIDWNEVEITRYLNQMMYISVDNV